MNEDTLIKAFRIAACIEGGPADSPVTETSDSILDALVGTNVLIRTVTNYWTGHVEAVDDKFIKLSTAAWIADTGRYNVAVKTGKLNEVEPVGDAVVAVGAIVDIVPWSHDLPVVVK